MSLDITSPQVISPEFIERLSLELLLQPDVMYPYARMLMAARAADVLRNSDASAFDLARMQLLDGRTDASTGVVANMMEAMAGGNGGPLDLNIGFEYPDLVRMVREAAQPGTSIKINRPTYLNGDVTAANRKASPTTKLFGTNSQAVNMDQVTVDIVEYLGPTLSDGTISPISLPRFTMHRSTHDLLADLGFQLRRDRIRFMNSNMESMIITALTNAGYITRPTGMSANANYTGTDNEPMSFDLLVNAGQQLKDRGIPGLAGTPRYLAILPTKAMSQLKLDPQYQRLSVFEPFYNPLFPGYVRTVDTMIVVESNNAAKLLNQGVGSAVTLYQSVILAPAMFGWGVSEDARALRNPNDDGGRSNEFGWSAYEGYSVLDDRFGQLIITD